MGGFSETCKRHSQATVSSRPPSRQLHSASRRASLPSGASGVCEFRMAQGKISRRDRRGSGAAYVSAMTGCFLSSASPWPPLGVPKANRGHSRRSWTGGRGGKRRAHLPIGDISE